jgi:hypothetical protein
VAGFAKKRIVPTFATEAEEAAWWYKTKEKMLERIAASKKSPAPVVALRIPQADLALARKQAGEKRGIDHGDA